EKCRVTARRYLLAAIGTRRLARPDAQPTVRSSLAAANATCWPRNAQRSACATRTRTTTDPPCGPTRLGEAVTALTAGFGACAAAADSAPETPSASTSRATPTRRRADPPVMRAMVPAIRSDGNRSAEQACASGAGRGRVGAAVPGVLDRGAAAPIPVRLVVEARHDVQVRVHARDVLVVRHEARPR